MNRKQKLIISITGISIVMLALLGITYGYYLTRIQGNTNTNSISLTTAELKLTYRDGTGELVAVNVMPGNEISSKTFTVENEGEQDVDAYTVALVSVVNDFKYKEDLVLSVSCSSNINNGKCDGFAESYDDNIYVIGYPDINTELFSIGIKKGEIHSYTLIVDYLYQDFDQSDDMGKTLKGKVQIYDPKDTIEVSGEVIGYSEGDYAEIHSDVQTSEIVDGIYKFIGIPADNHEVYIKNRKTNVERSTTLEIKKGKSEGITNNQITFNDKSEIAIVNINKTSSNISASVNSVSKRFVSLQRTIMDDTRIKKNNGTPDFSKIANYTITGDSNSGEIGMYSAEDDYGTSWYFRGAQSYNYVSFANLIWRVVRINGDNSVRMILDDPLDVLENCDDSNSSTKFCSTTTFSTNNSDLSFYGKSGYMQGTFLEAYSDNIFDFDLQNKNLNDSDIKKKVDAFYEKYILNYQAYLADSLFCGNKMYMNLSIFSHEPGVDPYIDCIDYYDANQDRSVSLKCADEGTKGFTELQKSYSRYTSKIDMSTYTKQGTLVNNDLKYPIALLSADEAIAAGFLYFEGSSKNNYLFKKNYNSWWLMDPVSGCDNPRNYVVNYDTLIDSSVNYENGIRPVINLKSNVFVDKGEGTKDKPYIILAS